MKYGTAYFRNGAIVWASSREGLDERIDDLTRLGFERHQQQPTLPQGMYWYARLVAPKGTDARKMAPSQP